MAGSEEGVAGDEWHGSGDWDAARAHRVGGRPTVVDDDKLAAARARSARGESPTQIAKAIGVSRASVYRHLGTT